MVSPRSPDKRPSANPVPAPLIGDHVQEASINCPSNPSRCKVDHRANCTTSKYLSTNWVAISTPPSSLVILIGILVSNVNPRCSSMCFICSSVHHIWSGIWLFHPWYSCKVWDYLKTHFTLWGSFQRQESEFTLELWVNFHSKVSRLGYLLSKVRWHSKEAYVKREQPSYGDGLKYWFLQMSQYRSLIEVEFCGQSKLKVPFQSHMVLC